VLFALGLICAFSLMEISKRWPKKWLIYLIIGLTLLEYANKPWDFMTVPNDVQSFYSMLNQRQDIKVIVEFPLGDISNYALAQSNYPFVETHYMLYQAMFHSKILFNGYSSYIPPEYTKNTEFLIGDAPMSEKVSKLQGWGVQGIVLHRDEMKNPLLFDILSLRLTASGAKQLYSDSNLALYSIKQ